MGNVAIHVVDRARPYLRSCGACGPVATGTTATAIFGIGARSPAAVWWCGRWKKGDALNGELSVRLRRWDSPHADLLDMRYKPAGSGNP